MQTDAFEQTAKGCFHSFQTQKQESSSSHNSVESIAAARISHLWINTVFTASSRVALQQCKTIPSIQAPFHAADTGAGDSGKLTILQLSARNVNTVALHGRVLP